MKIIGYRKPQEILALRTTCTAGGLTTWIEFFSRGDKKGGHASLIQGDTQDILDTLHWLILDIKHKRNAEEKK